jgi:hypothetical protein
VLRKKVADTSRLDAREENKQDGAKWAFAGSSASAATGTLQIGYGQI